MGLTTGLVLGALAGAGAMWAWTGWTRRPADRQVEADSQRLMVEALSNGTDGVALYDAASRLVVCNERFRILLRSVESSLAPGTPFSDLVAALARAEGLTPDWERRLLESNDDAPSEVQFKDGHWVMCNAFPTHDGGRLCILRDITIRKQTQISLETTVAWLKGVMETVADGIITLDEHGLILSFNRAAQAIFGHGTDDVFGESLNVLLADTSRHLDGDGIRGFLERRMTGSGREMLGRRRDGTLFPLEIAITEMDQGGMVTYIAVARDLTRRKQVEEALVKSKARIRAQADRLQAIIDNMTQGIAVFDPGDTLIALNRAALTMLALPGAEIRPGAIDISLFMTLLVASDCPQGPDAVTMTADLADTIRTRPELVFEHAVHNGMIMEVRSAAMPDGGLILAFVDITDRKHTEQTLRMAKDEAERGNRAKNTFLANISHELRTPLNAIIGFSEMMKHEIFGPLEPVAYRNYIDDIHDSGMHLLDLINDILDMSKAEAGMTDLQDGLVDLVHVVRGSVRMMARRAENTSVKIVEAVPARLPPLLADERRVRQVLLNLLSNAVKFSDEGATVTITAEIGGDGEMRLTVSDNGIGMSSEDQVRVMEPFVQADSRLSRKYEGSGLGLPLAKLLMAAHGGELTMESEIGQGTTVTITFPAERVINQNLAAAEI